MIQMPTYDIEPPAETVRTPHVEKPEPQSEPSTIYELSHLLKTTDGHGVDRAVLFSGGDDSLALTHYVMEQRNADFVIHLATNSAIPENIDYVRETCKEHGWPYAIISSPMPLDIFAYRYGFCGPSAHSLAYNAFKGRQLGYFYRQRDGGVKLFSGVRRLESERRMKNIEAEVEYADVSDGSNFSGWWLSPLYDKSDDWVEAYREKHDLRQNPVSAKIHRSGDCQCLAYGNRTEELIMIEAEYPDFAEWLLNVEARVQEYRGRVYHLEDEHPDVAVQVNDIRKQTRPHPMKLTVLKEEYPDIYDEIVGFSVEDARLRGQMEPTSYIGHGGLSSKELRDLVNAADTDQQTLCETCSTDLCPSLATSVQQNIEQAAARRQESSASSTAVKTQQTTLDA